MLTKFALSLLMILTPVALCQNPTPYLPKAVASYTWDGVAWNPPTTSSFGQSTPYTPQPVAQYALNQSSGLWVLVPGGGGTAALGSSYPIWTAAQSRVLAGTGQARVVFIGDSTTRGTGSNGSSSGDLAAKAFPTTLAFQLGARSNSWSGGSPTDARVSLGNWGGSIPGPGGTLLLAQSAATFTFTPTGAVDTFTVWYPTNGGLGSFGASVDGGAVTTVSCDGSSGWASAVISAGSAGIHTLSISWISGPAYFGQVDASNSVAPYVNVINLGWPGSKSGDWNDTSTGFAPLSGTVAEAADLYVLDLGINDWYNAGGTPIPVATYKSNMQAIIAALKTKGDVALVSPDPSAASVTPLATQAQYVAALQQLAATNNIGLIDNWTRWGSREIKAAAPYNYYYDSLHPNATGYADFASGIWSALIAVDPPTVTKAGTSITALQIIPTGSAPTCAAGTGVTCTLSDSTSTNTSGEITLVLSGSVTASETLATITFAGAPLGTAPKNCSLQARSGAAIYLQTSKPSTSSWTIGDGTTIPTAGTYVFGYGPCI